ncbi:hypothetical protein [Diaphorobacter sp. JS3051]|uniref:hypothetical protein n=1 Tax=Diaphorobacter sp. JS3051 TaxID=2792224 RepID=UPI0018CAE0EA|nr:hypothetical protein [Diaphorobacter sp. JS3051]QPN32675.1 hypothetical protein I3K84_08955 [Diaphorobacter sp. JS3051]
MQARACDNNPWPEINMTANDAQPMSQRQADALCEEWALLLKMGYASQWSPAQKMARQDEIAPGGHPNSPTDGHLKLPHLS